VHQALLSALDGLAKFGGKSSIRTWVFQILRNKLKDFFRSKNRWLQIDPESETAEFEFLSAELFDEEGNWRPGEAPENWGNPEDLLSNKQFMEAFEVCMDRLPSQTSTVFRQREVYGLTVAEICEESNLTVGCVNMTLSRARSKLRSCLQVKWFGLAKGRS